MNVVSLGRSWAALVEAFAMEALIGGHDGRARHSSRYLRLYPRWPEGAVLRNEGDEKFPNLVTEQVFGEKDPPTHVQGSDRPGREFAAGHSTIRSAIEPTDWHRIEEDRFVRGVCEALERLVRERAAPALFVVAPPRALADLRKSLHADAKAKVAAEIHKDLTKHPVPTLSATSCAPQQSLET